MQLLQALTHGATTYRGKGVNEEQQSFSGELRVEPLERGRAALLRYTAALETGEVVHTESTLIGVNHDGKLCLWPVMSELAVILPHVEVAAGPGSIAETKATFASGDRADAGSFREEISITIDADGSLVYAHAWGLAGGAFEERSSCRMAPVDT